MARKQNDKRAVPMPAASQETTVETQGPVHVQLREEQLVPDKQWVETGAVLVRKGVESETQTLPVDVLHEEVHVERVPVNRLLPEGATAAPWSDGDVLVIPIVEEQLVVTKRLVVREEMRISKQRVVERQEISDTVRRETIKLDTTGNPTVWDVPQEHGR